MQVTDFSYCITVARGPQYPRSRERALTTRFSILLCRICVRPSRFYTNDDWTFDPALWGTASSKPTGAKIVSLNPLLHKRASRG